MSQHTTYRDHGSREATLDTNFGKRSLIEINLITTCYEQALANVIQETTPVTFELSLGCPFPTLS